MSSFNGKWDNNNPFMGSIFDSNGLPKLSITTPTDGEIFYPGQFYADAIKYSSKPTGTLKTDPFYRDIAYKTNQKHFPDFDTKWNNPYATTTQPLPKPAKPKPITNNVQTPDSFQMNTNTPETTKPTTPSPALPKPKIPDPDIFHFPTVQMNSDTNSSKSSPAAQSVENKPTDSEFVIANDTEKNDTTITHSISPKVNNTIRGEDAKAYFTYSRLKELSEQGADETNHKEFKKLSKAFNNYLIGNGVSKEEFDRNNSQYQHELNKSTGGNDFAPNTVNELSGFYTILDITNRPSPTQTETEDQPDTSESVFRAEAMNTKAGRYIAYTDKDSQLDHRQAPALLTRMLADFKERIRDYSNPYYNNTLAKFSENNALKEIGALLNANGGKLNEAHVHAAFDNEISRILPDKMIESGAISTTEEYLSTLSVNRDIAIEDRESELYGMSSESTRKDLLGLFTTFSADMKNTNNSVTNDDLSRIHTQVTNTGLQIIIDNTTLSSEEVLNEYRANYTELSQLDTQAIRRRISKTYPKLSKRIESFDEKSQNIGIALFLTVEQGANRLRHDRDHNELQTGTKSFSEQNETYRTGTKESLKEVFPAMFENRDKDKDSEDDIVNIIHHNAETMSKLFKTNRRVAEGVMQAVYGNDLFYNIDAGLSTFVLRTTGMLMGVETQEQIDRIDRTADMANMSRPTEFGRWAGDFVKTNIVEIGCLVTSCIATGGLSEIPAALGALKGVISDVDSLDKRYKELVASKANKETIMIEMAVEITLIALPKFAGAAGEAAVRKVFKILGWTGKRVETIIGSAKIGVNHAWKYQANPLIKSKKENK